MGVGTRYWRNSISQFCFLLLRKIFESHKVKFIFHHAAISSVQKSINDPLLSNKVNLRGTLKLLSFARINKVRRFVFASSAAIYGDELSLPKNEESLIQTIEEYKQSKNNA